MVSGSGDDRSDPIEHEGANVHRSLIVVLTVAASLALTPAPASASTSRGGWEPWPTPPIDISAGTVCDFPVHGDPIVDEVVRKVVATYPDGSTKRQLAKGALILRMTNVATGASTVLDASGHAAFAYAPDGTVTVSVVGPILIPFRAGLSNVPRGLYAIDGVYRIVLRPDGFRRLTLIHGDIHNVCADLN
jgi:hypothetical protein